MNLVISIVSNVENIKENCSGANQPLRINTMLFLGDRGGGEFIRI